MPEYLQTTIDKFTFRVATDRVYAPEGVWVLWVQPQGGNLVRVGVTDYHQQHNGDVAFVTVKPTGTAIKAGEEFAEIETMKVTIGVVSPVVGRIVHANETFTRKPEIVNEDPYGAGWLVEMETTNWEEDRGRLLDAKAYLAVMQAQAEEELKS